MSKDNDRKHWKLGIFYYNKDNPDSVVDKGHGIGCTPNFGSKSGRWLIPIMLAPAIILMILLCIFLPMAKK